MLEKELEKKFCVCVKHNGGKAYKFISPGNIGVPDRLVIFQMNHIGFVELKREGGRLTKNQEFQMDKFVRMGCKVYLLDKVETIPFILEDIQRSTYPQYRWRKRR